MKPRESLIGRIRDRRESRRFDPLTIQWWAEADNADGAREPDLRWVVFVNPSEGISGEEGTISCEIYGESLCV
jgi:hypothetical protein